MLLFACAQSYIVVVGGHDDKEYLSKCEYFDAASSKWQSFASLNVKRADAAAASIGDSLFVFGGCNNEQSFMADAEEYTAVSNKWTVMTAHMNVGRQGFAAAVVSGRIYIVGGWSQGYKMKTQPNITTCKQSSSSALRRCQHGDIVTQ